MKILLTVPSFDVPKYKGLAKVSLELYNGLINKGFDIDVIEVHKQKKNYLKNLTTVPAKQLLSKADLIHAVTPESGTFLGLIKKFKKVKTIVTFHDLIPLKLAEELNFKFKKFVWYYTYFMWRNALKTDVVIAVSSQTAEDVKNFFGRKVDYIINPGVDERFRPLDVKKDKITLGFFANFSYRKGVDKAIEVFKLVKKKVDCKLILAGGELQTVYQRQFDVRKLIEGLEDVEVLGYIPDEKVVELYNSFDFYLLPSVCEGFGIPILEAQACGVPTLVFSWAQIPEETKAKAVQCKDVKEMAERILYLIENREEYKRVSKEGIEYAKRFSWKNFVEAHIKVYESLL